MSALYEALFIRNGVIADEGWPLYAAMQLQAGGTLYQDVFWVFPPASLIPAWLALALDPPGLVLARCFYAAFSVLLCGAIYLLGRRLMEPGYALLGGLLLAVAAPHSHLLHVVFGYRYLLFSVLALLCFSERLRSGQLRWTFFAGSLSGVALLFRLTPAFAVCVGIVAGIVAAGGPWKQRLHEGLRFAGGLMVVVAPVALYFGIGVGWESLWTEVVVRPLVMTDLQGLPVPVPSFPARLCLDPPPFDQASPAVARWLFTYVSCRLEVEQVFATLEFWLYPLLYLSYLAWLAIRGLNALRGGKEFGDPLLLAVVVWGGVFLLRSYGRADVFHLESAIPPVCLLIAHLVRPRATGVGRRARRDVLRIALVFSGWIMLKGVDLYVRPEVRGANRLAAMGQQVRTDPQEHPIVNPPVEAIERHSRAGDVLLDLSASPVLHVLTGRPGVGYADVLMPGTFLNAEEESVQLERIAAEPPSVVAAPRLSFDGRPERAASLVAPRIFEWVREHYVVVEELENLEVLVRSPSTPPSDSVR